MTKFWRPKPRWERSTPQIGQVISELARGARQQYQAAVDDENRYQTMLNGQKGNFQQLAGKRDQYNTMMTALNKTQELYQTLYQRAHEQALSVSLDQPDAVISDPAVPPERPAKPNKPMLWIIVVGAGHPGLFGVDYRRCRAEQCRHPHEPTG
ncbi:chain length determinant protein EpsF [Kluyvera cryocrescens]|uniref:Chain length determinant protein EpsF n=1 Tax=Kluyvera cryocrescens TaxID=580 RepID=A0A485D2I5_KLUCR|nr:chain length determinant protein EpsF [Kluyvera cryocrescens]